MAQQDDLSFLLSAFNTPEPAKSQAPAQGATPTSSSNKVADFVGTYLPLAERVSEKTGVAPEALLGQWGLETGWGKSVIPGTNNLGNIKDFSGKGPKAVDNMTKTTDAYRQYETVDDFGDDFAGLLSRRYRTALNSGQNTQKYFSELKRLGYAEDPNYVNSGVKAAQMVAGVLGSGRSQASEPTTSNMQPMAKDRSLGEAITDNALGAASGVVTGVKLLADTFGADNPVSQALDDTSKALTGSQSQYRKDQRQERQYAIKGAEASGSTWNEIVANVGGFLEAPVETTLNALGTSAPTLLMSVIPGLGQAQAARFILQGAAGAAQGVGAAKSGIYDSVREELIKTGEYSADEAAKIAAGAQAYDSENAGNIAINGLLGLVAGTSGIESVAGRLAGRKAGQETARGLGARAGMGVLKESPAEFGQGGFERYTSNVALQNEGFDVDPMQGVVGQAAGEAIASAPGGAAFGALDRGVTPPPAPNPLQPVVDQAEKPGSVLSRAVVSTGVADQPVTPPAGPDAGPAATQSSLDDPISARVALVESDLRINSTLEKIRGLTPEASSEFLYALNIAKNPNTRPDLRDQAITQVEQVLETAKSGTAFTMVPPEKTEPSTALTVPGQQGGELAPNGMGQFFDPNVVNVDATDVSNRLPGPENSNRPALPGPEGLPQIGMDSADTGNLRVDSQGNVAPETRVDQINTNQARAELAEVNRGGPGFEQQVAPGQQALDAETRAASREQQKVPATTITNPANQTTPPGSGSAVGRRRSQTIQQLVDQGFETVERREGEGGGFFLKNSKTGSEIKLDGMGDAAMARNLIQKSIRAQADQSPNSPRNDLPESTEAQNKAGNYTKPPVNLNGFTIRIENPQGSVRRGVDKDGVAWESEMKSDYGYIEGTKAKDGDGVDVVIGNRSDSSKIFVIDQVNEDGSFDEPKVVMGVTSEDQARSTYLSNYEKGWTGLGAITEMTQDQFKDWLKSDGPMKPTALGKKPAASKPAEQPAPQAAPQNQPQGDQKARWIKAILDNSRLAGDTGIQLDVTPDGKLNFLGNPDSSKQGRSLLATLAEARKAGATDKEIADAIRASKRSKAEIPAPQGQYATLEEAKNYLSQQRRANGTVTGLPIQMADGSFGIAIKGSREYAEAERQRDEREGRNKSVKTDGEFFTVPDGGKQRKLKKVSKGSMPKKASPRRIGEPRELTQDEAGLIEQVAAVLGKTVVFYDDGGQRMGDGFFLPNQPGVLYVAKSTTVNPLAVFGHEFFHGLRETNPEAWNAIAAVVRTRVADPAGFRGDYSGKYVVRDASGRQVRVFGDKDEAEAFIKQSGQSGLVIGGQSAGSLTEQKGGELEELVSDLGGNLMMDPTFWRDVFAKIAEDNGPASKGIIARLAAALENLIARVMAAMAQPGFRANQFVTEAEAIRAAYKDGLANYIKASGTNKASMGAEVAKASQQIKKSPGRAAQPGAITVEGYHFSQEPRAVLNTMNFGTGLQGSARDEIMEAADERIKQRLSFYVDKGTGINPESGVGAYVHKATLTNIYDGDADPLRLRGGDARAFEAKILDAGFSGYLTRMGGAQSGQVVLLGPQTLMPELLGTGPVKGAKVVPAAAQRDEDLGDRLMANKSLPADQLKPAAWADVLMASMPEDAAQLMDIGALSGDQAMFKDELAALARRLGGQIRKSTERAMSEYDAVVSQYKGTDQWLKAPDGTDTKLTERQWVQVRTPSFKAWFGDWEAFAAKQGGVWNDDKGEVSKAVDDNGEPLVVYHGTSKGGFSEFKTPGGKGRGDLGIFTTPNLEMAKTYNKRGSTKEIKFSDMEREAIEGGDTPGYYASFVNIRNPYETDFEGAMWSGERPEQWVVVNEEGETQYTQTGNQFFDSEEKAQEFADSVGGEVEAAPDHWETTDDAVREARSNKNDGAIIRSVIDDGGGYSSYYNDPSDVFVALDPNQLKSATQNTGEFGKRTDDMRFSRDRASSDVDPNGFNAYTATPDEVAQADAFEAANGVRPYTSAGQLQVPVQLGQIRKSVKREGKYGEHPILGIPVNANGTVSLYFPTTNEDARRIVRERTLKGASGADRVYLTNESGVGNVMAKMGNIDQDVDGANVLVQINPDLLHIDTEYEDGRKDFFIPIAEGAAFKEKMAMVRLFTQNAPRDKPLTKDTKLTDLARRISESIQDYLGLDRAGRQKRLRQAKDLLRAEHNVTTLLSVNGKLEKTNLGGYGINNYDGKDVMSMGLGLASAQRINEQKLSTCPQSAICESLCLGETSGQNLLYGGEGQFKSGPRMSQYLKTEAMVQHPEEFAIVLHAEIANFERKAKRDDYQATVRLNVTSDFRPQTFEAIINAFPGVMFYDYTKLPSKTISKNHHLTYSSTGASQVVNGKVVVNPESNWVKMVERLNNGDNVAMAFTDRNSMPRFVVDGKSGQRFQVWDGDNYDARFLDPKRADGIGMIIGLTNKDRTTKPEMAAEKHKGFFVDYNPERDGDTVVIPDQDKLKSEQPVKFTVAKFSRDRNQDTYNQRIAALKDLITCLKK